MRSRRHILIDLLHSRSEAALATQSSTLSGFPFASALAFAVDERQRPLLLISRLAEHTRNLDADPRACLLVSRSQAEGEIARLSLLGEVRPIEAEPLLTERYLRYHPEAARFLQLGDFRFHRLEPQRILVVGGFGQAGWLESKQLPDAPPLALDEERRLIERLRPSLPGGTDLLGVDAFGADLRIDAERQRITFPEGPVDIGRLLACGTWADLTAL